MKNRFGISAANRTRSKTPVGAWELRSTRRIWTHRFKFSDVDCGEIEEPKTVRKVQNRADYRFEAKSFPRIGRLELVFFTNGEAKSRRLLIIEGVMKRMKKHCQESRRRGASSLDAILVLGVILPLALFLFLIVPRMIQLVYEMTVVLINSPML